MKSVALTLTWRELSLSRGWSLQNALSNTGTEKGRTGRKESQASYTAAKKGEFCRLRGINFDEWWLAPSCAPGYTCERKGKEKSEGNRRSDKSKNSLRTGMELRGGSAEKGLLRYIWVLLNITRVCETLLLPPTLAFQELPLRTAPFANHPPVYRHH